MASMLSKHPWIAEEKGFFGRAQTDYDFEGRDVSAAQARLKSLQEEQTSLSKKVCRRCYCCCFVVIGDGGGGGFRD